MSKVQQYLFSTFKEIPNLSKSIETPDTRNTFLIKVGNLEGQKEIENSLEKHEELPKTKQIYLLKHCSEPKDKDSALLLLHEALLKTQNIHSWIELGLFKSLCHILTSEVVSIQTFQLMEKVKKKVI
jgi:hypothetical protein